MSNVRSAFILIIETIFNLYSSLILMRFLFQCFRVDFYNPFAQAVVKASNPLLVPLRKWIPGYGGLDLAALVLLLGLHMIQHGLIALLGGVVMNPLSLTLIAIASILSQTVTLYFYAIIGVTLMAWFNLGPQAAPIQHLLQSMVEPFLKPLRHYIPALGGLDFTPVAALLGLQLTRLLIIKPIVGLGLMIAGR